MKVKSGFVTLIGLPNSGKSSLLNRLVGEDIAIVSPKEQTTWQLLRGHVVREGLELVVIDTPGLQEGTKAINQALSRNAVSAIRNASNGKEILALLVDAKEFLEVIEKGFPNPLEQLTRIFDRDGIKLPLDIHLIPTITKSDLVIKPEKRNQVEFFITEYAKKISTLAHVPMWVSTKHKAGIEEWLNEVMNCLPFDQPGKLFDVETLTDKNMRDLVSEFIREQCFYLLGEEVPYGIAVEVERFDEADPKITHIEAALHVEKDSQKPIVIGKNGDKIKEIGIRSRERIEKFIGKKIFLGLRVKVSPHWARESEMVKKFGYEEK